MSSVGMGASVIGAVCKLTTHPHRLSPSFQLHQHANMSGCLSHTMKTHLKKTQQNLNYPKPLRYLSLLFNPKGRTRPQKGFKPEKY